MKKITFGGIIKTSIVTGFTIAVALIWKEVLVEAVAYFFPAEELLFKFFVAVIATIIVVFIIYFVLQAERETEIVFSKLTHKSKKRK